jgi:hypothetical protein
VNQNHLRGALKFYFFYAVIDTFFFSIIENCLFVNINKNNNRPLNFLLGQQNFFDGTKIHNTEYEQCLGDELHKGCEMCF